MCHHGIANVVMLCCAELKYFCPKLRHRYIIQIILRFLRGNRDVNAFHSCHNNPYLADRVSVCNCDLTFLTELKMIILLGAGEVLSVDHHIPRQKV